MLFVLGQRYQKPSAGQKGKCFPINGLHEANGSFTKNCYRNYSSIQLLLRDHLIVWDSIHGQDFQAPPACTNVLLATAKRSLPDSELGYNDSQKRLGNFSLPFVVRMKPVEIANYYCPEKQTKQGATQDTRCASG